MIDFKRALADQICHTAAFTSVLLAAFVTLDKLGYVVQIESNYTWIYSCGVYVWAVLSGAMIRYKFPDVFYT